MEGAIRAEGAPRENDDALDIRAYLRVLRARKWTIILVTLLVTGAALALSARQDRLYSAAARVYVQPLSSEQLTTFARVDIETLSQVAASEPVAALVKEDLGYPGTPQQLLSGLSAEAVAETQILVLAYTSEEPAFAAAAADSFAVNFLEFRDERERESSQEDQRAIEKRIQAASAQLTEVTRDLNQATRDGDTALASTLDTQRNVLIARLGALQQRLDDVQSEISGQSAGEVIQEAVVPQSPSSPNHRRNGVLGLMLGMILGFGAAFVRERLDDRFKGRADIEAVVGASVLGTIPRFDGSKDDSLLVSATDPQAPAAEAYRTLRTNVQFVASQRGMKSLVVTSPSAGEGKSSTSANLGVVMAQAGRRVILVSADLRRPTLMRYFGGEDQEPGGGLSSFLSGERTNPFEIVRDPGIPNLRVIPCGAIPPNPAELLSSPLLPSLVRALEGVADFVIVDSPPVLAVSDASVIAGQVGAALLVVDASRTHRSATVHSKEDLERTGGVLIGCVLNAVDASSQSYSYGTYAYGQYQAQGAGNGARPRRLGRRSKSSSRAGR